MKLRKALILAASVAGMASVALANGPGQGGGDMAFVAEWDMNGDGTVRLDDFSTRRGDQFAMFDLNGDGSLDADEQANMAFTVETAQEANHGAGQGQGQGQGAGQGQGQGQGAGQGQGRGQGQGQGAGQGRGQGGGHGQGGPGMQIHASMTAAYADSDTDGVITQAEWAEATIRLFTELDRSGDGILDRADFGRNG